MSLNTLTAALSSIGPSRVMFSVDYPFEDDTEQAGWFDGLELPQDLKEQIAYGNAMELFVGQTRLRVHGEMTRRFTHHITVPVQMEDKEN